MYMKEFVVSLVLFFEIIFYLVFRFFSGFVISDKKYEQECVDRDNDIIEKLLRDGE